MEPEDKEEPRAYPQPPDIERVRALRARLRAEKAGQEAAGSGPRGRSSRRIGDTARDIGTYTLIPSLMIAGPLVGYVLGYLIEKYIGGAPWGLVGGVLLGVVAGFRQVILLLKRRSERPPESQ